MPPLRLEDEAGGLLIGMAPSPPSPSAAPPPALDALRRAAAFHNTVDVWVSACVEAGTRWDDAAAYAAFVGRLRSEGVHLRPFGLCVSDEEGGSDHERAKAAFARAAKEGAAGQSAPPPGVHSVRLDDRAVDAARRAAASASAPAEAAGAGDPRPAPA